MSDDADVDQLLDSFQKALDTLSNIENVEALITKLDANKNRKLLKKVKHVVSEAHSKVASVKEKVSKAYKRVKLRSSSESEEVPAAENTDKDITDREEDSVVDQNEDSLNNVDDEGRYSPIVGGKGKTLKRPTRQADKLQENKNDSLENGDPDVNNKESEKNEDNTMQDKDATAENGVEEINVSGSSALLNLLQLNPGDKADQTVSNEKANDVQSSEDIIEGTPEKSANKITRSLNKTIHKDVSEKRLLDSNERRLDDKASADEVEVNNEEGSDIDKEKKSTSKKKKKRKDSEVSDEDKIEDTPKTTRSKRNKKSKDEKKQKDTSDSDDIENGEETDETSTSEKKRRDDEVSDEDEVEDTSKTTRSKRNKKSKDEKKQKDTSDSDDIENGEETDEMSTSQKKRRDDEVSDEDEVEDTSKTTRSKRNKKRNDKERRKDTSDSDDIENGKETAEKSTSKKKRKDDEVSDEDELEDTSKTTGSKRNKKSKDKEKQKDTSDSDDIENGEETAEKSTSEKKRRDHEVSDEDNTSKTTGSKRNKKRNDEEKRKDTSDSDDIENGKETAEKPTRKKKKGRKNDEGSDEDTLEDTSKTTGSKRNKKSKNEEKKKDTSDSDDNENGEEIAEKSFDQIEESNESDENNKENSSEGSIITIEDTPKKLSDKRDNEKDDEKDPISSDTLEIKTEENSQNEVKISLPKIKLVDINKLLAPNTKPLDVMTPSPKAKKSVTFDSSVIILSSSDEETPKKDPKNKNQSPLKSAMRKASSKEIDSDSDSKENNENLENKKSSKRNRSEKNKVASDHSSDDSDFEDNRRSRRLKRHEKTDLKSKFSQLAEKYNERKSRNALRRLRSDNDKEDRTDRKNKKRNKDKKLHSESDDDDDDDSRKGRSSARNKKRRRKKEILEESSLSEHSDKSDSDNEIPFKKQSSRNTRPKLKKAKVTFTEGDKNDPKFKARVVIRLPTFKCEDLQKIYKRKKDIFEVKKLTKMDFARRTRSTRNGSSKSSDDSDKPDKKRIKLTLKLNRKEKTKEDSSDDERSSTEENKDEEVSDKEKDDKGKKTKDTSEGIDPLDIGVDPVVNDGLLAEACLEQIKENSDKEDDAKQDETSSSDEAERKKNSSDEDERKKKKGKSKNKENKDKKSDEESSKDSESGSTDKDEAEEPKVNGKLSDSEEDSTNEKDKKDQDESSDEEKSSKKKGKKWKNDKLLNEKIDSSDSDSDFSKFSKKKDKANSELVKKPKKRVKKSKVISDSDSEGDNGKKKKKTKDSDDDEDSEASGKSSSASNSGSERSDKEENSKKRRKRIKRVKDSSSDEEDKSTRKNIRRMIDRDSLSETTKKAEHDEKERKSRIAEKQKKYNLIFEIKADAAVDKVVLDFDEKTNEPLLSVHKKLAKQLKPHQVQGIKFMWDACFESLERLEKNKGSGCILAHCMGLGKTLQVVALSHTLLTNSEKTKVEKILVVCPVNTVLNWKSEFKKWTPKGTEFEVYELVSCKTSNVNHERNYIVRDWHENGGVLIIGYNMFRTLSNPDNKTISKKLRTSFTEGLVDPGPDLVVCDEGHLLKNEKTHLSIAMNRLKTTKRIVLTGTPLQNNLREYWCMVQFIKPNLLGTYKEYLNRFVNPIINGQYTDSTQHDIVVMRRRSHVLHKLLDGVVQRKDYSVLEPYLPPKHEYVLFLKLTEVQIKLYNHYLNHLARKNDGSTKTSFLFADFQQLQRICTHPRVLLDKSIEDKEKKLTEDSDSEGSLKDFIDDGSDGESTSSSESSGSKSCSEVSIKSDDDKKGKHKKNKRTRLTRAQAAQNRANGDKSDSDLEVLESKEWWEEFINKDELDNINHSSKIFLLFEILKECEEMGDKVLVFSQSLYTLNCIEYFLQKIDEATQGGDTEQVGGLTGSWAIGLDYFRLDGSSSCDNRANWCDQFNDPDNTRARLFLISTKAGGLGINLVAANRVIIFDVSWNPSHDIQSIYRVYRFGQTKPCYIYRFVTYGAMEMKIYERQVTKQAISKRVIDEQQIDRHYSQNDIQELYQSDLDPTDRPIPLVPKDVLLGEMLQKYDKTIFKYHEHQSLLENKEDEELNEEERKAAWEEFENEKVVRKTSVTNFTGINFAAFQNAMNFSPQLIQVALANIVRKDNPTWSEIQIRGILPALVTQLQMQMSENDFSMYNRVQQEIRLMQALQAQRMRENYLQQYQLQQMLQKQQMANQVLGNLNVSPEELRRLQAPPSQNYINPQPRRNPAGGSGDVIELND